MIPVYVGIDPGKGGGIAVVDANGHACLMTRMPETEREIIDLFMQVDMDLGAGATFAMLELVRSSPQMGVVSAFTFGKGYGTLRTALAAAVIPYDEVTPGKWQQAMGCRSGGDKNVTKRRALELFPSVKVTHAIADALLLAEYCRRVRQGSTGAAAPNRGPAGAPLRGRPGRLGTPGAPHPPVRLQDGPAPEWTCPECGGDALSCAHNTTDDKKPRETHG